MEVTKIELDQCQQCGYDFVIPNVYPYLSESGPHIKLECPRCKSYIKFISREQLPTLEDLRTMIWFMAQSDARFIQSCKILCRFDLREKSANGMYVEYWNLLLKIVETIQNAHNPERQTVS